MKMYLMINLKIYRLCERERTGGFKCITNILTVPTIERIPTLLQEFENESGTKSITNGMINPELKVYSVSRCDRYIKERKIITFTRLGFSSHSLNVERGKRSKVARETRCQYERIFKLAVKLIPIFKDL